MADIINEEDTRPALSVQRDNPDGDDGGASPYGLIEYSELLFFAYRDFISDPDAMLAEIGFGRAHHRVLHFVTRRPGLRVADLLVTLNITKQSLARVLRQLIDRGFIEQRASTHDGRERLLFPTRAGAGLTARLERPQLARLAAALAAAGPDGRETVAKFLRAMVSPETDGETA